MTPVPALSLSFIGTRQIQTRPKVLQVTRWSLSKGRWRRVSLFASAVDTGRAGVRQGGA